MRKNYNVSANDIGHAWQAGLSNATIENVNVLSENLNIKYGWNIRNILHTDGVDCKIKEITVL